jgi:homoserine kinase
MSNPKPAKTKDSGWQVTVPATSANLGCAFDCGGLALQLYLRAQFVPAAAGELTIAYKGNAPEGFPLDRSNLVLSSLCFATAFFSGRAPAGHVVVESEIPIGVGLGSSAAAVIAGLLLGAKYCGQDIVAEQILRSAEELEGHVDNAAAALLGGLVFALSNNSERLVTLKSNFPQDIKLVVVSPSVAVATHEARRVLPESYERADVLHTLQRTAILAATCFSGKFELFPELFDDKLHQPYRQKLVPGIERSLRLRHEGLLGIAISGSGSSVIAFARGQESEIAQAVQKLFADEGVQTEVRVTSADNTGATITEQEIASHVIKPRAGAQ